MPTPASRLSLPKVLRRPTAKLSPHVVIAVDLAATEELSVRHMERPATIVVKTTIMPLSVRANRKELLAPSMFNG